MTQVIQRPSVQTREIDTIIKFALSGSLCPSGQAKLQLMNMPSAASRALIVRRMEEINASFKHQDVGMLRRALTDMFASYNAVLMKPPTGEDSKAALNVYMNELKGLPSWAVDEACAKIRLGTAGGDISRQYKPTPIQVRVLVESIILPWKAERQQISDILAAEQYRGQSTSEDARKSLGARLKSLADEIKQSDREHHAIEIEKRKQERAAFEAALLRHRTEAIVRDWEERGEKPMMAGDMVVSRSLAETIKAQNKEQDAALSEGT